MKLQGNYDVFAAVKARDGARIRSEGLGFGGNLVIGVGIEANETVLTGAIGDIGLYRQGADVFQIYDSRRNRILRLVEDRTSDSAQFRLGPCRQSQQRQNRKRHQELETCPVTKGRFGPC